MNFVELSNQIFKTVILDYHQTNDVDTPIANPYPQGCIEHDLYLKNWISLKIDFLKNFGTNILMI